MYKKKEIMKFLIETGYEDRLEEMQDLNLALHDKIEQGEELTSEEEGMYDLLQWLYHDEDKPNLK